jgi:hypothetical protein
MPQSGTAGSHRVLPSPWQFAAAWPSGAGRTSTARPITATTPVPAVTARPGTPPARNRVDVAYTRLEPGRCHIDPVAGQTSLWLVRGGGLLGRLGHPAVGAFGQEGLRQAGPGRAVPMAPSTRRPTPPRARGRMPQSRQDRLPRWTIEPQRVVKAHHGLGHAATSGHF